MTPNIRRPVNTDMAEVIPTSTIQAQAPYGPASISTKMPPAIEAAHTFLEEGAKVLAARAQLRDSAGGERSMATTVAIFNAWTGLGLSVEDGWRFMIALKQAREIQGTYHRDDYVDGANYFALLGEEESGNARRRK